MRRKRLIGAALMTVSLTAAFVALGLTAGWAIVTLAYGIVGLTAMFSTGLALLTEKPEHPYSELNYR